MFRFAIKAVVDESSTATGQFIIHRFRWVPRGKMIVPPIPGCGGLAQVATIVRGVVIRSSHITSASNRRGEGMLE
jgi:hypothetical protein